MSGFVGMVHFDRAPVQHGLLERLTRFLAFRGPDAQHTWIQNHVGFGHTLFKTIDEPAADHQPLSLDGNIWIVADARIDAREELVADLKSAGARESVQLSCTDAELIVRAYKAWGEACVEHLLGDFAFAIWDDARQVLFCARDHMGVKPFYYAQFGPRVIFSNTLDSIRLHALVSDKLNDLAVADFLLFGFNQDSASTTFSDIHRLPPAHCAMWSRERSTVRRYWSLPVEEPIFYKRANDYVEQFRHLLGKGVADRLRTRQVWVFMSGGLDSPTLAATARNLLSKKYARFDLRALTKIDPFAPDEEAYAAAAANYLGIPMVQHRWTEDADFQWERLAFPRPEPHPSAWLVPVEQKLWNRLGTYSRVFFYGEGPDSALRCDWQPYLSHLLQRGDYARLLNAVFTTLLADGRPPFWQRFSNKIIRFANSMETQDPDYPEWLNRSFESRWQLRSRWIEFNSTPKPVHAWRPGACRSLQTPLWQAIFEAFDAGTTGNLLEVRYPFMDVRMLRFLLAAPPLPWCRSKYLLRTAMRGSLPREVLRRRKTTPESHAWCRYLVEFCRAAFKPAQQICEYVNPGRLAFVGNGIEAGLRVRSLNHWLQNSYQRPHNLTNETHERFVGQNAATR